MSNVTNVHDIPDDVVYIPEIGCHPPIHVDPYVFEEDNTQQHASTVLSTRDCESPPPCCEYSPTISQPKYQQEQDVHPKVSAIQIVRDHPLWRHTLGRIESIVKIPIYFLGGLFLLAKGILRLGLTLITFNRLKKYHFSLDHFDNDLFFLAVNGQRIYKLFKSIIVAPEIGHHSIWKSLSSQYKAFLGWELKSAYVNFWNDPTVKDQGFSHY
jgi:hypothetical protein